ncbi:RPA2B, partial [Symbiodinium sp. CCMP2456]
MQLSGFLFPLLLLAAASLSKAEDFLYAGATTLAPTPAGKESQTHFENTLPAAKFVSVAEAVPRGAPPSSNVRGVKVAAALAVQSGSSNTSATPAATATTPPPAATATTPAQIAAVAPGPNNKTAKPVQETALVVPAHGARAPSKLKARSAADQGNHSVSVTPVSPPPLQAAQPAQAAAIAQAPQSSAPPREKASEKPIPAQLPEPQLVSAAPRAPPSAQEGRAVDGTFATSATPASPIPKLPENPALSTKPSLHVAGAAGGSPAHLQPAAPMTSAGAANATQAIADLPTGTTPLPKSSRPTAVSPVPTSVIPGNASMKAQPTAGVLPSAGESVASGAAEAQSQPPSVLHPSATTVSVASGISQVPAPSSAGGSGATPTNTQVLRSEADIAKRSEKQLPVQVVSTMGAGAPSLTTPWPSNASLHLRGPEWHTWHVSRMWPRLGRLEKFIAGITFMSMLKALCMAGNILVQISPYHQVQRWEEERCTGDADAAPYVSIAFGGWQWCYYGLFAFFVTKRSGFLILVHSNCLGAVLGTYYSITFYRNCKHDNSLGGLYRYMSAVIMLVLFQLCSLAVLPIERALFLT